MIEPLRGSLRDRALISSADLATLVSCSARAFIFRLVLALRFFHSAHSLLFVLLVALAFSLALFVLADWFSRFVLTLRIVLLRFVLLFTLLIA